MNNELTPKQNHLNRQLMRVGLATLDNPRELLDQIAFFIDTHDDFRNLLVTVEPDKRRDCYESIKPRLRFEAKTLEEYVSEAARKAEVEGHAIFDSATGNIYESRAATRLDELAQEAIRKADHKGSLSLVCSRCTFEQTFTGKDRIAAIKAARKAGWVYIVVDHDEQEICPKCPAPRPN